MTEIRQTMVLDVPPERAEACILDFFKQHRNARGAIRFPLHVSLEEFVFPSGLRLERSVNVHVAKRRDAQNLNDEIAVTWDPGAGEPFPSFSGSMTVWNEDAHTLLELRGTYEPPFGAAGRLFDDVLGHLLAERTARQFLLTLAEGAQACFHR